MDSKQHTQPSGTVAPKPRIEFVDLAKGFCIILVVLFHLQLYMAYYTPFDWMARSFRMPLYFILSGLFFKEYEGFLGFLKRKTNKLLIPFLAFYLLSNLVLPFLGSLVGLCSFDWKMPFAFFLERSWPNVAIWFLWCLFSMNLYAEPEAGAAARLLGHRLHSHAVLLHGLHHEQVHGHPPAEQVRQVHPAHDPGAGIGYETIGE